MSIVEELQKIEIYQDGRSSLADLYSKFLMLEEKYGWHKEIVYSIKINSGEIEVEIPVFSFLSPTPGKSLWVLTGIHGEEPAGPNAVARQIDRLGSLGQTIPMVVMPLLNPAGYYKNWRFHHVERSLERLNVTDCRHLIGSVGNPRKAILDNPVHEIADISTKYILKLLNSYPPLVFFDLHEDELLSEGYVYSQGILDSRDPVAAKTVEFLVKSGVPLKMSGQTRFPGERIIDGLVTDEVGGRVRDGSIDEFIANDEYFDEGKIVSKPQAKTSIVTESPAAGSLTLEDRIRAQESILTHLEELWQTGK